jgi:hypothetical protein
VSGSEAEYDGQVSRSSKKKEPRWFARLAVRVEGLTGTISTTPSSSVASTSDIGIALMYQSADELLEPAIGTTVTGSPGYPLFPRQTPVTPFAGDREALSTRSRRHHAQGYAR